MKKPRLLSELTYGFREIISKVEFEVLKEKLIAHSRSIKGEDVSQLSKDALANYPEFQVLHDAYMRRKLKKIADATGVIKIIVVVYFVCSIITALYFIMSSTTL